MELVLVAAVARNGAIGRGNELVFRDPADQRHFRTVTMGHPVVMGRKTWQSLPERFRPLPGRRNVVLSRDSGFTAPGAEVMPDLTRALQALDGRERVCIIGGAQLYEAALPQAQTLELTEVDAALEGDVFFPPWPRDAFRETARESHSTADGTRFDFVTYRRK